MFVSFGLRVGREILKPLDFFSSGYNFGIIMNCGTLRICGAVAYACNSNLSASSQLKMLLFMRSQPEVEQDPYCREVLGCRMQEGFLPKGPVFNDVTEFHLSDLRTAQPQCQAPHGIVAGFPCQVLRFMIGMSCD